MAQQCHFLPLWILAALVISHPDESVLELENGDGRPKL